MIFNDTKPIAPVTVEECRAQARIDDESEDALLESYIIVATQQAEQIMQREIIYRQDPKALSQTIDDVPLTVKQFILCYVADLYAHRELHDASGLTVFYEHLLDPFILYNRDADEDETE